MPEAMRSPTRLARCVLVAFLTSLAVACTDDGKPRAAPAHRAGAAPAAPVPVRGCKTAAYGDLGRTPVNRAGPIGFVDSWARSQPVAERRGARVRPTKVLVVVDTGTTVTVTVPDAERDQLRLLYAEPIPNFPDGFYAFADGAVATTFEACEAGQSPVGDHRQTQFPGYFLVNEPGCYRLDVSARGLPPDAHADLSLGRPCARSDRR
jgi:hypothetical protein